MTETNKAVLSVQDIQKLKARGVPCPADVDPAYWDSVQAPPPRDMRVIADLARQEMLGQLVELGIEQKLVTLDKGPKVAIDSLSTLAVTQLIDILADPASRENAKLDVAKYIIDHAIGKAKQEVEHTGSVALELRAMAEQYLLEKKERPVVEIQKLDKQDEFINNFIQEHSPDGFVVGKKSDEQEG